MNTMNVQLLLVSIWVPVRDGLIKNQDMAYLCSLGVRGRLRGRNGIEPKAQSHFYPLPFPLPLVLKG